MKNKLRFILPRLIVLTAIAGLATLIIGTIFKLLLFGTVLFGIGSFAAARMRRRDRRAFQMDTTPVHPNVQRHYDTVVAIVPLNAQSRSKRATIVPVY
ncbi:MULTISPECIES: hypothetical protein [unclassified Sphingobacterium]|uniref:hypothetical protein n=1 Tax=unclassified Sphingobacterium TaxID=2609468 RepID=UPI0025F72933|nr:MULTISPECIES: hypothetical protein [unclassified Sphingobacterium]